MKITRLSSTEVANTSVLPIEKRLEHLQSIEKPKVFWNYGPVEAALPKLLLADCGLFGSLEKGDDELLIQSVEKACKSSQQANACEQVSRAIVNWRNENNASGRIIRPEPFRSTVDTLRYCCDVAVVVDGSLWVVYLDPRSSMVLSSVGREFIKSLIHHTALIGDLRDARVAILRTPSVSKGRRVARFEELTGEPYFSMEEIIKRVVETYSIWETVLRSRRVAAEVSKG